MPSLIKRFNNQYNDFNDSIEDLLVKNELSGIVPTVKESDWIRNMHGGPLDKFNLFLLSEGFMNTSATVITRKTADEYYTTYPAIIYKHNIITMDRFFRYVNSGMRRGYVIKFINMSPNRIKMQDKYLLDEDEGGAVLCVNKDRALLFGNMDGALYTLEELQHRDILLGNKYLVPRIIESRESPFSDREIILDAFTYTE